LRFYREYIDNPPAGCQKPRDAPKRGDQQNAAKRRRDSRAQRFGLGLTGKKLRDSDFNAKRNAAYQAAERQGKIRDGPNIAISSIPNFCARKIVSTLVWAREITPTRLSGNISPTTRLTGERSEALSIYKLTIF